MSDRYKGAILSPTAPTVTPQSAGGIYTSSQQLQYQGQGVWPTAANNPLTNSLRFRSSAPAYLSRTFSSGDQQKWTFSVWLKKALGRQTVFGRGSTQFGAMQFDSTDTLSLNWASGGTTYAATTSQVFRDPSAWYHLVWAIDTTQATSTNRQRLYVNGTEVTAWSTYTTIPQNTSGNINTANSHWIGRFWESGFEFPFDGYMTEINFVNAVQLTPSSFGTTDAYGIWQPIPYTGAYGTNGFYLPFTDNSALTTSSNVGLGKDFSGNGNYWVTNNISITAGSTYDSMKDVPTNTNSNTANYPTINPIDYNSTYITLSEANLRQTYAGVSAAAASRATMTLPTTGKWYWEVYINATGGGSGERVRVGIASPTDAISGNTIDNSATHYMQMSNGQKRTGTTDSTYGASFSATQIIQVLYDATAGSIYFGQNNSFANGSGSFNQTWSTATAAFTGLSGVFIPAFITYGGADISVNFGQRPFSYTPPTGFLPLNTYNLPTPTILAGNQYMNATLWTGNGSTTQSVSGVGFQPDFVWVKGRSVAAWNRLQNTVAGINKLLYSNDTAAEATDEVNGYVSAVTSDGFTLADPGPNGSGVNGLNETYVGWQWRASNSAGVSNTQGTITSTVSANTTAGFSIVTFTAPSSGQFTVGHGLGVTPNMVIVKNRTTGSTAWFVYHSSLGVNNTDYLVLNSTAAEASFSTMWGASGMTSSTCGFTVGGSTYANDNHVAYCFAQVAGYSAFGSYTGNGSTDGTFVYTGFRPRYVLLKCSSATESWYVYDSARDTYNVVGNLLVPNQSGAEANFSSLDFLSNGFKLRTSNSLGNTNGATYIYMAFAENPFKIARAR